jgi:dUTP pyrophosphatase
MKKPRKAAAAKGKAKPVATAYKASDIAELMALAGRFAEIAGGPDDDEVFDDEDGPVGDLSFGCQRLPHAAGLPLPSRQSDGASGLDLCAAVPEDAPVTIAPGKYALIPTGFAIELPPSFEAQVRPRSGLALKHGVTVLNAPGTIDSDYRGEIQVILINHGEASFTVARGDRIAQLVIGMIVRAVLVEEAEIGATERGAGGFGSTGKRGAKR